MHATNERGAMADHSRRATAGLLALLLAAPALADEWAYVSAQSAAGFGPAMFDRFVHRFNRRLAEMFTNDTVYYHGCERLDHKLEIGRAHV